MYRVRGMGDAATSGSQYTPGDFFCTYFPTFLMTSTDAMACEGMVAPAVPNAPTQAQLTACQNSADPATCANDLVQTLTNQAVTETQTAIDTAVGNTPSSPDSVPFCGDGSTQWISGIDNCTLLEWVALGVAGLWIFSMIAPKGRR